MKRPSSAKEKKLYKITQQKNLLLPKYLPNINSMNSNNQMRDDALDEELKILQYSWNELGITQEYRNVFMNILEDALENERYNIIAQEKNNMKKFKDAILSLKKEIENRESNLTQLKKSDFLIQSAMTNEQNASSINSILQNVISLIKNLRINAVNIVKKVIKVNQITSYYSNSGKFNIYNMKPEYSFDSKYLFKMKNDLKFLRDSAISVFIEMNNTEIDPFLTNCAPAPNKIKGTKRIIPISDDVMKSIIESRYLLLQETVLDSIDTNNIKLSSVDLSETNILSKNWRNNLLKRMGDEKIKLGKSAKFNNKIRVRNNFMRAKAPNISRYIQNLKTGELTRYNSLFYKKKGSPSTTKKKFRNNNSNRIVIMHEEIKSLSNEQFMKRLGHIENMENDNMIRNEILNENIENLENENNKLKKEIKEIKAKLVEEEEKIENLENKNNEITKRAKEYQNELEQISQKKKKKENELNNKIEQLQKDMKKAQNENNKAGEELHATVSDLENKLKNEETMRQDKEKQIENLDKILKENIDEKEKLIQEKEELILTINQLKIEKNELEKNKEILEQDIKKINEEKNSIQEENQKMNDTITKLEEINKEQNNIIKEKEQLIKEKEEENQKIITEKNDIEKEKLKIQEEYEKLKEDYENQKKLLEKLKEDTQSQKNEFEKLNEDYQAQKTELMDLMEKNKIKEKEEEEERERLKKEEEEKERLRLEEEEKERLKKEEEEKERLRLEEEEKERLKKEEEEKERLKKEEEEKERLRLEEEEKERLKLEEKEKEKERFKKEEEEKERLRLEEEEKERFKLEEEEKLKQQKEQEEKENINEDQILLRNILEYSPEEINKEKEIKPENKPEKKEEPEQNLPLVNDIINPEKKEEIKEDKDNKENSKKNSINKLVEDIIIPEKNEDNIIERKDSKENQEKEKENEKEKSNEIEINDINNSEKKSEDNKIIKKNEIEVPNNENNENNIERQLMPLDEQIKYNEENNVDTINKIKEEKINEEIIPDEKEAKEEKKEEEIVPDEKDIKEEKKEEEVIQTEKEVKDEKKEEEIIQTEKEINNITHTDNEIKDDKNRLPNLDDIIKDTDQNKEIKDDNNINNNINDINQMNEKKEEQNNEFNDFEKMSEKKENEELNDLEKKSEKKEEQNNEFNDFEYLNDKKSEKIEEEKNIPTNQENKRDEDNSNTNNNLINIKYESINPNENANDLVENLKQNNINNNEVNDEKKDNKEEEKKEDEEKKEEEKKDEVKKEEEKNEEENREEEKNEFVNENVLEVNQQINNNNDLNDFNLLKNSNLNNVNNNKIKENNSENENKIEEEINNKENINQNKEEEKIDEEIPKTDNEKKSEKNEIPIEKEKEEKKEEEKRIEEDDAFDLSERKEEKEENIKEIQDEKKEEINNNDNNNLNNIEQHKENPEEKKEQINNENVQENIENNNNIINKEENVFRPLKESVNANEVENSLEAISDKKSEKNNEIPAPNSEKINKKNDDLENKNIIDTNNNINQMNKLRESDIVEDNENKIKQEEPEDLKEEKPKEQEEKKIENNKYKVDYYRDNLFNLLNQINEDIPLESIPDFLKRAFNMNDSLFSENFYYKGIFPKIVVSRNENNENKITGLCSFYYESNEDLNKRLILRINSIYASQDYEEQIIKMINFIKNEVESDKIMIYILYDKVGDKFLPNAEAKALFENKLNFRWFCVVRDEKLNQRYIKYCYDKIEENYDLDFGKNETTKEINAIRHNKNNFLMNNLLLASINEEKNYNLIKEQLSQKINYNKFINIYSLYFLLLQLQNIKLNFNDQSKKDELESMNKEIMKFSLFWDGVQKPEKTGIKDIRDIKEEIIPNSIFNEIEELIKKQNNSCSLNSNLLKTNLFINFENNFSVLLDDNIYYNRIASDKIQLFEDKKTESRFFLVPSKDNNILFYICEVNQKLKNLLIDGNENVYEKFLEFQPSTQKKIFEFSLKSVRDVTYIPVTPRNEFKTICIPCFSFKTHLFAYDYKEINKNVKLFTKENETPLNITSIDEFINIEFKPDPNINNSFSSVEAYDLIIKDSFIMGIFDNDIINGNKLPLLQFLYVTKDKFLTKSNYNF